MEQIAGNIFLVGLMGAGKTTIGKALARKLNKVFFDSDQEIEAKTGVRIATIFDIEGEDAFRRRETEAIATLTHHSNIVLATGGGAILRPENRIALSSHGTVVYLRASIEDLIQRLQYDKSRPLLQTADPKSTLQQLLYIRDPLYRETAHITLETGQRNINVVVNELIDSLSEQTNRTSTGNDFSDNP